MWYYRYIHHTKSMFHTRLTSKGQVTVPQRYRRRMRLTGRRNVSIEQRPDGSVVIRPAKSILRLAGSVRPRVPRLSIEEERKAIHDAVVDRHRATPKQPR
jgi:bifunctional DNA-binding transcriptional regulator/antitoxin component of YhaV-PrlF toxin-antitoxin module